MKREPAELWTIGELDDRLAETLSVGYSGVANGRVRDVPDQRTIRYYSTLGLLDRPAEMRGRTAYYGRRHLLQLVAIKRLQARDLSLAEIQRHLLGASNATLERLAAPGGKEPTRVAVAEDRSQSFWRAPAADGDALDEPLPHTPTQARIRLERGLVLEITTQRDLTQRDRRLIRMASAPLVELLRLHQLIGPDSPGDRR
jgi:DNA-binding transcriptional MerR regulator